MINKLELAMIGIEAVVYFQDLSNEQIISDFFNNYEDLKGKNIYIYLSIISMTLCHYSMKKYSTILREFFVSTALFVKSEIFINSAIKTKC